MFDLNLLELVLLWVSLLCCCCCCCGSSYGQGIACIFKLVSIRSGSRSGKEFIIIQLMALLVSKGLIWGNLVLHLRAGGGFRPGLLICGRVVHGLLLDVHWHGNMDWLLDDDLLINGDTDGDGIRSGHVNDLRDGDGVGLRHFHGVGDGHGPRNGHVLEDRDRVVSNDGNGDTNGFRDWDGDGLWDWDWFRDGDYLLDGLINGDFDGDIERGWDGDDFRDGDDFGDVNDFGDWHVFRDVYDLMDYFNYRGLVVIMPMAMAVTVASASAITPVTVTGENRGEGAQKDY